MSIWKRAIFWTKVKDSLAIGGLLTQGGMEVLDSSELVRMITVAGTVIGYLITMWMEDKNGNGTVDIFETEVTTTITSKSPIEVTTEEKPKE